MSGRRSQPARFEISTLLSAVIVLVGVLTMTTGFYLNDSMITYLGILVTGAASWMALVFTMVKTAGNKPIR